MRREAEAGTVKEGHAVQDSSKGVKQKYKVDFMDILKKLITGEMQVRTSERNHEDLQGKGKPETYMALFRQNTGSYFAFWAGDLIEEGSEVVREPCHDLESFYWVFIWAVLRRIDCYREDGQTNDALYLHFFRYARNSTTLARKLKFDWLINAYELIVPDDDHLTTALRKLDWLVAFRQRTAWNPEGRLLTYHEVLTIFEEALGERDLQTTSPKTDSPLGSPDPFPANASATNSDLRTSCQDSPEGNGTSGPAPHYESASANSDLPCTSGVDIEASGPGRKRPRDVADLHSIEDDRSAKRPKPEETPMTPPQRLPETISSPNDVVISQGQLCPDGSKAPLLALG
ncbi:hypothetical protein BN946_scf184641.g3 [Trametes cinnabarina]|uniref:Fungal-type protein kinase domain-containing protein n=1 Tax=Pycnoporus cinnabarinus TaxID=5643 RepID=A0A060SJ53_PYCCI|nr:hypothetical protein BN946_scf184641.g3 [Trametes cinnabarina]